MTQKRGRKRANLQEHMPDAEHAAAELAKAESMDDFFGKDGVGIPFLVPFETGIFYLRPTSAAYL